MNDMITAPTLAPDFSDRVFTINLILSEPDTISVRSCEVIGRRFRNRTSFADASDLQDVLVENLAVAIRKCLAKLPDEAQVLALPDFVVEMPGLALYGVRIMIMDVRDGVRSAIFRFKEFLGSVNYAFVGSLGIEEPYATYGERLAVNVLSDVCLPLLNVARELEFAQQKAGAPVPADLEDRVREFEFQTELLKRFIFNSGVRTGAAHHERLAPMAQNEIGLLR